MTEKTIVRRTVSSEQLRALPADMHHVLRRVYAARGVTTADLDTRLASLLPISRLEGTQAAAARLARARARRERVLVVGDFDADGATATALMMSCLKKWGFESPAYLVPDRFRFGYGLSAPLVEAAGAFAPDLIVTVDNGISSVEGVEAARAGGIDVIVTDHHLPGERLPGAAVIVNPNAPGSEFPSKALSGVGVAFYVMAATGQHLAVDGVLSAGQARADVAQCLDLVALGTVADLVPLDRNNRVLVAQGITRIRAGSARPGINALFAAAGRNPGDAVPADLGFAVAPRLNAAGRLDDIGIGIRCLLADDQATAERAARMLSGLNEQRKALQAKMQAGADKQVDKLLQGLSGSAPSGLCLFDSEWHQGVVGLIATRVRERLNRPVLAFARADDERTLKGSGRSVRGIHMRDLLAAIDARNPGLIERFGGHAMAAGLSLRAEHYDAFREAFVEEADVWKAQIEDDHQVLSDGPLGAGELGLPLAEQLRVSGPWGQGFPEPLFDDEFRVLSQRVVGGQHLKLVLEARHGDSVDAIAFNRAPLVLEDSAAYRIAYRLDVNEFRGVRRHQLVVEHMECV